MILSANGCGETDVCGALVLAVQTEPVYPGFIQAPCLGVSLEAWNDEGEPAKDGQGTMVSFHRHMLVDQHS